MLQLNAEMLYLGMAYAAQQGLVTRNKTAKYRAILQLNTVIESYNTKVMKSTEERSEQLAPHSINHHNTIKIDFDRTRAPAVTCKQFHFDKDAHALGKLLRSWGFRQSDLQTMIADSYLKKVLYNPKRNPTELFFEVVTAFLNHQGFDDPKYIPDVLNQREWHRSRLKKVRQFVGKFNKYLDGEHLPEKKLESNEDVKKLPSKYIAVEAKSNSGYSYRITNKSSNFNRKEKDKLIEGGIVYLYNNKMKILYVNRLNMNGIDVKEIHNANGDKLSIAGIKDFIKDFIKHDYQSNYYSDENEFNDKYYNTEYLAGRFKLVKLPDDENDINNRRFVQALSKYKQKLETLRYLLPTIHAISLTVSLSEAFVAGFFAVNSIVFHAFCALFLGTLLATNPVGFAIVIGAIAFFSCAFVNKIMFQAAVKFCCKDLTTTKEEDIIFPVNEDNDESDIESDDDETKESAAAKKNGRTKSWWLIRVFSGLIAGVAAGGFAALAYKSASYIMKIANSKIGRFTILSANIALFVFLPVIFFAINALVAFYTARKAWKKKDCKTMVKLMIYGVGLLLLSALVILQPQLGIALFAGFLVTVSLVIFAQLFYRSLVRFCTGGWKGVIPYFKRVMMPEREIFFRLMEKWGLYNNKTRTWTFKSWDVLKLIPLCVEFGVRALLRIPIMLTVAFATFAGLAAFYYVFADKILGPDIFRKIFSAVATLGFSVFETKGVCRTGLFIENVIVGLIKLPFLLICSTIGVIKNICTIDKYLPQRWQHFKNFFTEHSLRHTENILITCCKFFLTTLCGLNSLAQTGAAGHKSVVDCDAVTGHVCDPTVGQAPALGSAEGSFGTNQADSKHETEVMFGSTVKLVTHLKTCELYVKLNQELNQEFNSNSGHSVSNFNSEANSAIHVCKNNFNKADDNARNLREPFLAPVFGGG